MLKKKGTQLSAFYCDASREIRTPVLALKGLRPGPLDDGGDNGGNFTKHYPQGQVNCKIPFRDNFGYFPNYSCGNQ